MQEELRSVLMEVGFGDRRTEEVKVPFMFESAEAFAEVLFQGKNAAAVKVMEDWPWRK